ncbi:hypothetical protein SLEP1_g20680 [Rubroshorea leprosula]|uniref:Uncharacterized protein n=1 Tax=Rubroshorea leprosula TaxID=152421 RepID=A0AAV5JCH3_9ROSI|nr:hypothetical protein SLEP1_g20680 [Rubroshorea leprosula]
MRRSRYLFLLLCSPILLPLLCATFPLLCAAEFCFWICRWRRRRKAAARQWREEEERLRGCEEGCGCNNEGEEREVGLLHRYLEDQLMLVGSVYDCGDDRDSDGLDYKVPLLR